MTTPLCKHCFATVTAKQWDAAVKELHEKHRLEYDGDWDW